MESLIVFGLLYAVYWFISSIFGKSTNTVSGASSNPGYSGPFQIRIRRKGPNEDRKFEVLEVEARGAFPVARPTEVEFVTSVFDVTDGEHKPVLSFVEGFQEGATTAYQHRIAGGTPTSGTYMPEWGYVGAVIPEVLIPPVSGARKLQVVFRVIDKETGDLIHLGFGNANDKGELLSRTDEITHTLTNKGYEETARDEEATLALSVKLAVAIAFSDGNADREEVAVISHWIERSVGHFGEARTKIVKELCNDALRKAFSDAKASRLSISEVARELNEKSSDPQKYQAIELCFDVMAADGAADPAELDLIRRVSESLDLDIDELQKIKDQRMVGLDQVASKDNLETVLGIDPSWAEDKTRKHLRAQFSKWNARLTQLTDQKERANAQEMLDLIAEARKKYA